MADRIDFKSISNIVEKIKSFRKNFVWPSLKQWRQFFHILTLKEKYALLIFLALALTGSGILGIKFYLNNTQVVPGHGGSLKIAMIGSPRFLNPTLDQLNNIDRELSLVFFSSLMKYDNQGNLIPDLTEKYEISEDGKTYDITLHQNIFWQDGVPLSVNDVIFTLQTIQDPDFRSPLRTLWQGTDFEKIDDRTIRFRIKNTYAPFLHTLTFGILPEHLWENIAPAQFPLNDLNLKPIGSGPYKFSKISKDGDGNIKSLEVRSFDQYFLGQPHIANLAFFFYESEAEAITSYKKGEVDALSFISISSKKEIESKKNGLTVYQIRLPRYFAAFFNSEQNPILADKTVREALAFATDKETLIKDVLDGEGSPVNSPLLPGMTGYTDDVKKYNFDLEQSKKILADGGWKDINDDGILEKEKTKTSEEKTLEITLTTNDWPDLVKTARELQLQWQAAGFKINLDIKDTQSIQSETIKPRQYQILLFGEVLGLEPDPFSFWHSSQKKDPGLNLSLYDNIDADRLLADARQDLNNETRSEKYQKFSKLVAEDLPAMFLFSPNYLLAIKSSVMGVEFKNINSPSSYLSRINDWFLTTSRAWK